MSGNPETSDNIELIGEQFRHAVDLLKAANAATQTELEHTRELMQIKINDLQVKGADIETRVRAASEIGIQFKFLIALAGTGGVAGIISLITNIAAK